MCVSSVGSSGEHRRHEGGVDQAVSSALQVRVVGVHHEFWPGLVDLCGVVPIGEEGERVGGRRHHRRAIGGARHDDGAPDHAAGVVRDLHCPRDGARVDGSEGDLVHDRGRFRGHVTRSVQELPHDRLRRRREARVHLVGESLKLRVGHHGPERRGELRHRVGTHRHGERSLGHP